MTAPVTTHTGTTGRAVHRYPLRGTGLWQANEINGRPAQPHEIEVRERAWAAAAGKVAELVKIAPRRQP